MRCFLVWGIFRLARKNRPPDGQQTAPANPFSEMQRHLTCFGPISPIDCGQGHAIYAQSGTDFSLKMLDIQVAFERNPTGEITGLVLHRAGTHTPAKKVK